MWTSQRRGPAFLSLLLLTSALSVQARAQTPVEVPEAESVDRDDGRDTEAWALFQAGQAAFGQGRFQNSLDYFERAYELSNRAQLLFHIGVSAERLQQNERAMSALRQYLVEVPDSANRASIEGRLEELEGERDARLAREAEEQRSVGPGAAPWLLTGVGAALAITGVALVGTAVGHRNAVQDAPDGTSWGDVSAREGKVEPLSTMGFATLGLGGAMVVSGLLWWALAPGDREDEAPEVALGFGTVSVRGRF